MPAGELLAGIVVKRARKAWAACFNKDLFN